MRAIVQDTYGSAEVLRLDEVDPPVPGHGEVLVRVRAAGLDPGVWHLMHGLPYLVRAMGYGLRRPKARVPGFALAGTVEAVGSGVSDWRPGDDVFGIGKGAFAELAVAPAHKLAPKPARLTFVEAAAVPISADTALQGLRDHGKVRRGQRVLVIGAAGGVGSYAVQLAKAFGAHVTGVCSTSKADLVRSLGADEVIDYTREDPTDGTRRFHLILDTAGNRPLKALRRALTPTGTLVIVGGEGGKILGIGRQLRAVALSPLIHQNLRMFLAQEHRKYLDVVADLIEAGKVRPVVDRTYPLGEAPDAVRDWESGHARGKVVIVVGGEEPRSGNAPATAVAEAAAGGDTGADRSSPAG